jgi:hypothetical protein
MDWSKTPLSGVERLFGALNIPCRNQKGKHLFEKSLDSERSFGEHVFMPTNVRSKTSPVSTPANSFPLQPCPPQPLSPRASSLKTVSSKSVSRQRGDSGSSVHPQAAQWWERPPATAGSVHVSLSADRRSAALSSSVVDTRVSTSPAVSGIARLSQQAKTSESLVRTGAPTRRASPVRKETSHKRLGATIAIIVSVLLGGFGIANASSSPKSGVRSYVVRPGDSFWSIARSVQLKGDLRPLVADLIDAHGSGNLLVGDRVELPAR